MGMKKESVTLSLIHCVPTEPSSDVRSSGNETAAEPVAEPAAEPTAEPTSAEAEEAPAKDANEGVANLAKEQLLRQRLSQLLKRNRGHQNLKMIVVTSILSHSQLQKPSTKLAVCFLQRDLLFAACGD